MYPSFCPFSVLLQVVELSPQNVVMDSFIDTQSKTNSLQWFAQVFAYLAQYGQRVSLY